MSIDLKKIMKINAGIILLAVGLYFLLLPSNLVVGGVSGFATVLNHHYPWIPVGGFMMGANVILFALGFIFLGREFGGYTIYAAMALSLVIMVFEKLVPLQGPIVDDLLLNLIYGIIISGSGMGIIFYQNASTGGTDIIAKIINKFTGMDLGKALLMSDFAVIVMATFTFGIKLGMYAMMGNIINSFVIDNIIAGFNKKLNLTINSQKHKEINDFILQEIERGTTLYYGQGGFSKEERVIINSIVSKKEYIKIQQFVKSIDPEAFMSINFVSEVHGRGFSSNQLNLNKGE